VAETAGIVPHAVVFDARSSLKVLQLFGIML